MNRFYTATQPKIFNVIQESLFLSIISTSLSMVNIRDSSIENFISKVNNHIKDLSNFQLLDSQETTLSNNSAIKIVYTYKDINIIITTNIIIRINVI